MLGPGITVLAGLNGSGKTRVLELLEKAIPDGHSFIALGGAQVHCQLNIDLKQGADDSPTPAVFNPVATVMRRKAAYGRDAHFLDLLDGVDANELGEKQVKSLCHIVGKDYSRIAVSEIEDTEDDSDGIQPFFHVTSGAAMYDSMSMGLGELAALEFFWFLGRIRTPTILLIDEHHALVSQHSAGALLDLAAEFAARDIYCVIATHSSSVLDRLEANQVLVCSDQTGVIRLQNVIDLGVATSLLGSQEAVQTIVFVEDQMAATFVEQALALHGGSWIASIDVTPVASGVSGLKAIARYLPHETPRVQIVAVLDGDQQIDDLNSSVVLATLPGPGAPEEVVRKAISDAPEAFAEMTGSTAQEIHLRLTALQGRDHHDWLPAFANSANLSVEDLVRAAIRLFSVSPEGSEKINNLVATIRDTTPMSLLVTAT